MITLFENITQELTKLERETLVPMLIDTLRFKTAENKVSTKGLCAWFRACGYKMSPIRIRKMIAYIRQTNAVRPSVVIGSSDGYYLSGDLCEMQKQVESLRQRARKINQAADAIEAQYNSSKMYKNH